MGDLCLEVGGQVDDMDGPKRAFFRADATTDTQTFRDVGNLGFRGDFDAKLARANHGAGLFAFLPTFLQRSVLCVS